MLPGHEIALAKPARERKPQQQFIDVNERCRLASEPVQHRTGKVRPSVQDRQSGRRAEKDKAMLKTFTAALIAASVIAAPVLAQGTASTSSTTPATQATKAPEGKAAVKTVKAKKHKAVKHSAVKHVKHAKHRKHVKAVKADTKPAEVVKTTPSAAKPSTTGSAPKTSTN
jgi:hypothetical protein